MNVYIWQDIYIYISFTLFYFKELSQLMEARVVMTVIPFWNVWEKLMMLSLMLSAGIVSWLMFLP